MDLNEKKGNGYQIESRYSRKWNNRYIHKKKEIQDTGIVILHKNWRGGEREKGIKGVGEAVNMGGKGGMMARVYPTK